MSSVITITTGVRQGGLLSSIPFAVYMDNLNNRLKTSGHGCYLNGVYYRCLA